jgi:hypothetical protein
MCGIVFALRQSTRNNPNPRIFANLLIANESRGRQATGIWGNGMYKDTKAAGLMFGKLDTQAGMSRYAQLENICKWPVVIGHTRQGTTGINTKANAHPFRYKNTVGCHNGVLSNYDAIATKYSLPKPEVDSQVIFSALVEGDYDMARVSEIHGSIAFVMNREETRKKMKFVDGVMQEVDVPSNITYIYRRDNPLFVAKRNGILYGSSLAEPFKTMGMQCVSLEADTLYVYTDGRLTEKRFIEYTKPAGYDGVDSFGWTRGSGYGTSHTSTPTTRYPVKTRSNTYKKEDFQEAVNILITQCLLAINEIAIDLPYQLGYDDQADDTARYCLINSAIDTVILRADSPVSTLKEFMVKAMNSPGIVAMNGGYVIMDDVSKQYAEAIKWIITYSILQLNGADDSYPTTIAGKEVGDVLQIWKGVAMGTLIEEALVEFPDNTDFSIAYKHANKFGFTQIASFLSLEFAGR